VEKERKIAHQVLAIVRYLGPRNRATPAAILFFTFGLGEITNTNDASKESDRTLIEKGKRQEERV
jgi:hypothetical protein